MRMFTQSFTWSLHETRKKVYRQFTLNIFSKFDRVYTKFTCHIQASWPKLEMTISSNFPFETSQRTDLITHPWSTNCARSWCIWPIRHHMTSDRTWSGGSFMAHQKTKNKCPISANSNAPCTTLLEGPAVQVWACPEAPDRFYGRGKTGPNTDSPKIEYPKNSLFRPDKWAPAPPGDW